MRSAIAASLAALAVLGAAAPADASRLLTKAEARDRAERTLQRFYPVPGATEVEGCRRRSRTIVDCYGWVKSTTACVRVERGRASRIRLPHDGYGPCVRPREDA